MRLVRGLTIVMGWSFVRLLLPALAFGGVLAPSVVALSAANEPSGGEVLLADDFDDPAAGVLPGRSPSPDRWTAGQADGEYRIVKIDPAASLWPRVPLPGRYEDSTVALDARIVRDTVPDTELRFITLLCRFGASGSYMFRVDPFTRSYRIVRYAPGELSGTTLLLDISPAILPDSATNRVEMTCAGDTISGRVNGVELGSVQDSTHREGRLLIGLWTIDVPGEARFDNLVVTAPSRALTEPESGGATE